MTARLVFAKPGNTLRWARLKAQDEVVFTRAGDTRELPCPRSLLREATHEPDMSLVTEINGWLTRVSADFDVPLRACLLSQLPFLTSTLGHYLHFAWRLDAQLAGGTQRAIWSNAVREWEALFLRSCAAHHGQSLSQVLVPSMLVRRHLPSTLRLKLETGRVLNSIVARWQAKSPPPRTRLLVVTFQLNSTRSFLPAARALREQGIVAHFLVRLRDRASQALIQAEGFEFETCDRYIDLADGPAARAPTQRLLRTLCDGPLQELLAKLGFPAWFDPGSLARYLEERLVLKLERSYRDVLMTRRALGALDPRACLYITNRAMMNELLLERGERTKRIFFLQGIVPEIPPLGSPLTVDLAVFGSNIDSAYIERCQIPREVRRVTGYPDYDRFALLDKQTARRELEAVVPQLASKPLVVFTSQYSTPIFPGWAREKNLEVIVEAARLTPHVLYLVKAHPLRETLSRRFLASLPENVVISPPFDTAAAMKAADVVVTYWSTTALEAVLLGSPLVQLNATGLPDFFDISGRMGRPTVRNAEQLAASVERITSESAARDEFVEQRERFMAEFQLSVGGNSARRAADAIAELLVQA